MPFLQQIKASQLGITPCYVKNQTEQGILFYPPNHYHRSEAMGAQCANCQTIIWVTGRWHPVLYREIQLNDGIEYRKEYQNRIKDFLTSLPKCPECQLNQYGLFIDNVTQPQLKKGIKKEQNKNSLVWWLGTKDELDRLHIE